MYAIRIEGPGDAYEVKPPVRSYRVVRGLERNGTVIDEPVIFTEDPSAEIVVQQGQEAFVMLNGKTIDRIRPRRKPMGDVPSAVAPPE